MPKYLTDHEMDVMVLEVSKGMGDFPLEIIRVLVEKVEGELVFPKGVTITFDMIKERIIVRCYEALNTLKDAKKGLEISPLRYPKQKRKLRIRKALSGRMMSEKNSAIILCIGKTLASTFGCLTNIRYTESVAKYLLG